MYTVVGRRRADRLNINKQYCSLLVWLITVASLGGYVKNLDRFLHSSSISRNLETVPFLAVGDCFIDLFNPGSKIISRDGA